MDDIDEARNNEAANKQPRNITALIVYNFKSFAGKHKIGPFLDFTAIIGPNGGGKSNIMDAVSFVLGVRSSELRASNLKELIFRKESEKVNEISRECYVKLRFITANKTNLVFKRTISNSGSSDYFINKVKESTDNYQGMLQELNIIVKAKNFLIFQGQVDALAMKSGKELTSLFERISGSDEFKLEYDNSKTQVDICEENLKSITAKISFLTSEKKKLKEQKAQSVNYENIVNKIKELQSTYYLLQFTGIEREIDRKRKIIEEKSEELEKLRRSKEKSIIELRDCNINLKQTEQKLINVSDDASSKINLIRTKKPELSKLHETIKQFENRITAKTENLDRVYQELEKETKRYKALIAEQKIFEDEIENKQRSLVEELKVSISDNKKANFFQLKKEFGIKAFAEKKELERAKKELSTKEINISLISQQLKDKSSEKQKLDNEIENLEHVLSKKNEQKQNTESLRTKAISDLTTASQENEQLKTKELELIKKLESLDLTVRDFKVIETCKNDHEKEKSVIEDMIRHRKTVKGLLGNLITPIQPKYSTAINACLGGILEYLIVDDVETAQYVHNKLRDHGLVKEVLVLENIPETRISESLRHNISNYGCLLTDVINYDKNYGLDKAITLLISNKALADSLEKANELRKIKGIKLVVTLDGVCIKNGMISSPPSIRKHDKVSQKKVQAEKEAVDLRNELIKIQEILRGENTVGDIRHIIENLTSSLSSLDNDIAISSKHLETMINKRKEITYNIKNIEQQLASINSQTESMRSAVSMLDVSIKAIEDATFKEFCRDMGIPSIKVLEGRDFDEENKIQETINQLKKESVKITWSLKSINLQNLKENYQRIEESITKDTYELDKMKIRHQTILEDYEKLSGYSNALKEQEKHLKDQINKQIDLQHTLQINYDIGIKNANKAEKEFSNEERDLDHLYHQKNQKIEELFVKNLEISIISNNNSRDVDFSRLDKKYLRMSANELDKEADEISKTIEKETKNLEQLVAQGKCTYQREKLLEIQGKLEEANRHMEQFDRVSKDAKSHFLQVKEKRRACFMETFDLVANNIVKIYKDMTKAKLNRYFGGNALLYADNTEEPYNGGVIYSPTPPGKRCMYEMDQLSGGEKTIAALSLLFAIHSAMPSPFYIMDEVDAFLDWENCQLLLNYLQQVSTNQSQCILITHKEEFFCNADSLIGTTYIPAESTSKSFSFDLTKYGPKQLAMT